jgi:nucleoside diphosphate kinase
MFQDPFQALRSLGASTKIKKTKVGRIRELLPEIENAQKIGISLQQVVEALKDAGFPTMDIKCLQNLLFQARHSKDRQKGRQLMSPAPQAMQEVVSSLVVKTVMKSNGGIDVEKIMNAASKAAQGKRGSELTLALLRGNKPSINGN